MEIQTGFSNRNPDLLHDGWDPDLLGWTRNVMEMA